MNAPVSWHNRLQAAIGQNLFPREQEVAESAIWRIERYAHVAGLDNRWQMFGRQSRFNWHFQIKGLYGDGRGDREWLFPEPRQSSRTLFQKEVVDFKEAKFHLNIYGSKEGRMAYAYYLAKTYPHHDGLPLRTVVYELHHTMIRPPEEARALGEHMEPRENVQNFDIYFIDFKSLEPTP